MNKRGQSIIEYVLIAVLVILGVVVMGPYVLRSIGAHFKLWDEGAQDSFTENITQAPVNSVPDLALNCNCTNTSSGSCGSTQAGSQCSATQKIYYHNCNPQGCDGAPTSYCLTDPSCCMEWQTGVCGKSPISTSDCSADSTTCTPLNNNNDPTSCYWGYRFQYRLCGANNTGQCALDPACPQPACFGTVDQSSMAACPNSPGTCTVSQGCPALTDNANLALVADVTHCDSTGQTPCQYYCNTDSGYTLVDGQCVTAPPDQVHFIPADCNNLFKTDSNACLYSGGGGGPIGWNDAAYICQRAGFTYVRGATSGGSRCDTCRYIELHISVNNTRVGNLSGPSYIGNLTFSTGQVFSSCDTCYLLDAAYCADSLTAPCPPPRPDKPRQTCL